MFPTVFVQCSAIFTQFFLTAFCNYLHSHAVSCEPAAAINRLIPPPPSGIPLRPRARYPGGLLCADLQRGAARGVAGTPPLRPLNKAFRLGWQRTPPPIMANCHAWESVRVPPGELLGSPVPASLSGQNSSNFHVTVVPWNCIPTNLPQEVVT